MEGIIVQHIIEIIKKFVDIDINELDYDTDFLDFGMDSITFIKLIVKLEEEFKCEIPDSKLIITEMNSVRKVYDVIIGCQETLS